MSDPNESTAVVDEIDYSKMTADQLMEAAGAAWDKKDLPLMKKILAQHAKAEASEAKDKKDALQAVLADTTTMVRKEIHSLINKLIAAGKLDGAECVYYAQDLGEIEEVGINPSCKLIKSGRKASTSPSSSTSSYVSNPTPSKELLAQVGEHIMFAEDEEVTIDKVKQTVKAGTTFQQAYDKSTNGGWRNRVRMALLKEAGLV